MKNSEILKAAKAKIATPATWIQRDYAKDANGHGIFGTDPGAVCFCSLGAIQAVTGDVLEWTSPASNFLSRAIGAWWTVACFNDNHTHAEVMAKWDEAIALAEAEEAQNDAS